MNETFNPTSLHAWVHNLDPFALQFTETFGVRWYGLAYLAGFILGALLMIFLAKRGRRTLPEGQVVDFITYVVIGTMVGGRLGYALFYDTSLLTSWNARAVLFGHEFKIWNLLAVWEGGMASHGGIIGITVAAVVYAKRHRQNWMHLGDLATLGGTLGVFFGRIANFINGELQGRVVHAPVAWAVKFPTDLHRWISQGPKQLEKLTDVVREVGVSPENWGQILSRYPSIEARRTIEEIVNRIIFEIQNGNAKLADLMQPLLPARHPSQLYQGLGEGLLVFCVLWAAWYKPRKPGFVGGLFLIGYSVMRIIGEQFREPDAHIGYELFGLTRGQWLSIGMLVGSFFVWWFAISRKAEVIGGWGPEAQRLKRENP